MAKKLDAAVIAAGFAGMRDGLKARLVSETMDYNDACEDPDSKSDELIDMEFELARLEAQVQLLEEHILPFLDRLPFID